MIEEYKMEFGYYPKTLDVTIGDISISTLPNLSDTIKGVEAKAQGGWYYADIGNRLFKLPQTHMIEHQNITDESLLDFLVSTFGFFVGMEMCHDRLRLVDSATIKPQEPFLCLGDSLNNSFLYSENFWKKHKGNDLIIQAMKNIISSLFRSKRRGAFEYEIFMDLYYALEGVYYIYSKIGSPYTKGHKGRIKHVCDGLRVNIQPWKDNGVLEDVVKLRNATTHDGLFLGKPFGHAFLGEDGSSFSALGPDILFQMEEIVTRLIVALLEIPVPNYLRTFTAHRTEGLKFSPPT